MCGIWGIFNKDPRGWINEPDMELARTMMIVSSLRGDHSTGVCIVPGQQEHLKDRVPIIGKTVGGPFNFLHTKAGVEFLKYGVRDGNLIFGHNRFATKGEVSTKNAHPFKEGDWILVHNGTIHSGLKMEGEVEVDSHALCHRINEAGLKEAILSINGAYAIFAYNIKEKKLYAARNDQRPLYYFTHDKFVYAMSEEDALAFCLRRHDRWKHFPEKEDKFSKQFKPDVLYVLTGSGFEEDGKLTKEVTKSYFPVVNRKPADRVKYEKVKAQQTVTFIVDSLQQVAKSQWRYNCQGVDGAEDIFFETKELRKDLIMQVGEAPIHMKVIDKTTVSYHVRFKDIAWIVPEETTCKECGDAVGDISKAIKLADETYICHGCIKEFMEHNRNSFVSPEALQ